MCRKKVKQTCPCRRLRKEFPCDVARTGQVKVECDDVCKQKMDEEMKVFVCLFVYKLVLQFKLEVTE
jgi:hypothetical protein